MEGTRVGSYEIKRLLGKGGMGEVYLAEHALLGRPVAIKFLLSSLSANEELVARFFDEARATTAASDPGIVQIFDFGHHTDGSAYIVMELLEGETLDTRLVHGGPLEEVAALRLARHLANALGAAHQAGVVHRDLKLENVFLVADPAVPGGERPKVLDFGIAKLARIEPSKSKTRTGAIMGTPIYMSPEQCKGAHDVDARSDVYALGCVLYCMVIGRPPFDYDSAGELIAAHLREEAPTPSATQAELGPGLDAIVARCLAKTPAARFQSMAALASAITAVLGDDLSTTRPGRTSPALRMTGPIASAATSPATPVSPLARPTTLSSAAGATMPPVAPRSRRWMIVAAALLLIAIGGLAAAIRISTRDDRRRPSAPRGAAPPIAATSATIAPVVIDAGLAAEPAAPAGVAGTPATGLAAAVGSAPPPDAPATGDTNPAGKEPAGKRPAGKRPGGKKPPPAGERRPTVEDVDRGD